MTNTQKWTARNGWLLMPVAAAICIRFLYLDQESLFLDEVYSMMLANPQHHLSDLWRIYRGDVHPPLYYMLLWSWVNVFPYGDVSARMLSALIGSATLLFVYFYFKWLLPRRIFVLFVLMFCFSYGAVYYAQEVRMYAPLLFGACLSFGACLRAHTAALRGEDVRWTTGLLLFTGGLMAGFSQYYGVIGANAMAAALVLLHIRAWRRLVPMLVAAIVLAGLTLTWMFGTNALGDGASVAHWLEPDFEWVTMTFSRLLLSAKVHLYIAIPVILGSTVLTFIRRDPHRHLLSYSLLVIAFVLAVGAGYTLLVHPVLVPRALLVLFPAAYLAIATTLVVLCDALGSYRRAAFAACVVLAVLVPLPRLVHHFTQIDKEDRRGSTAFVLGQDGCIDGSIFVIDDGDDRLFRYYADRIAPGHRMSLIPLGLNGQPTAAAMEAILRDSCPVVAWSFGRDAETLRALFQRPGLPPLRYRQFHGIVVAEEDRRF